LRENVNEREEINGWTCFEHDKVMTTRRWSVGHVNKSAVLDHVRGVAMLPRHEAA
jgi:hypothetical protein